MKILHICLANFFIDNYAYQENLLTKYHKKMGHEVTVIASLQTFNDKGEITYLKEDKTYYNEYGIKIKRLNYKGLIQSISKKLRYYQDVYKNIVKENPDIIFIHGVQFSDIKYVIKYKKNNPDTKIYIDNHADFSNSATNWLSENILHKVIWRYYAKKIEPYTEKFYGVMPSRVDFLANIYKIPKEKIELLLMGADDDKINFEKKELINKNIRSKYNISLDDFLIITGGKIDFAKKQTIKLIKAIKQMDDSNIKLIIFGSIIDELKEEIMNLVDEKQIIFIGWIDSDKVYDYFLASDLGVFPGRHSVLWEQAIATGLPCVFKEWKGTKHVDLGGNCKFLYEDKIEEMKNVLFNIINNRDVYRKMKITAEQKGIETFSYSRIAKKSINT